MSTRALAARAQRAVVPRGGGPTRSSTPASWPAWAAGWPPKRPHQPSSRAPPVCDGASHDLGHVGAGAQALPQVPLRLKAVECLGAQRVQAAGDHFEGQGAVNDGLPVQGDGLQPRTRQGDPGGASWHDCRGGLAHVGARSCVGQAQSRSRLRGWGQLCPHGPTPHPGGWPAGLVGQAMSAAQPRSQQRQIQPATIAQQVQPCRLPPPPQKKQTSAPPP